MRIVAGEMRSRTVEAVKGMETRPTQDHIKEAIFNRIGPYFEGGKMLDLFAGSGNIGFESLSRGIEYAVLVDKSYPAIQTITKNATNLKVMDRCRILKMDYMAALGLVNNETFSLIYIDPPYALDAYNKAMNYISDHTMVEENGIVVLESAKEDSFAQRYGDLELVHEKIYGISKVTIYRRKSACE